MPAVATTLAREHFDAALQYERCAWDRPAWIGLKLLALDEQQTSTVAPTARHERRELLLYGGSRWRLTERSSFAPELELDWVDVIDEIAAPGAPRTRALLGKLTLPLEVVLDRKRDARLVFNPGLKLHELKFGGAQITLAIPLF